MGSFMACVQKRLTNNKKKKNSAAVDSSVLCKL